MKKIELLIPAGDIDSLRYACNNGADAIYLGMQNFSARAYAKNFSKEDFLTGIKYAHSLDVKVYVTINTLIDESNFNNAIKMVDFLYKNGVDALIIQDLGLLEYLSKCYPELELHASTQMHIHNLNGAKFITKKGIKRVVLARETPLDVVRDIVKSGIEVECFSYGALCVSYSGQCLFSSFYANRSANKGACAQFCRMLYRIKDVKENKFLSDYNYNLSMKDLNTINEIPKLIEAGISSLKIEGRMKKPEYVALITKIYRSAIDSYYEKKKFELNKTLLKQLKSVFYRGFTKGFINGDEDIINKIKPNHLGIEIGEVVNLYDNLLSIKLKHDLNQFDGIRIQSNDEIGFIVNKLYRNNLLVNKVLKNQVAQVYCDKKVKKGAKVYLTSDFLLSKDLKNEAKNPNYKFPVIFKFKAKVGETLFLEAKYKKYNVYVKSDLILEKSTKDIEIEKIDESLKQSGNTFFEIEKIIYEIDKDVFIPLSQIKKIRRDVLEKLNLSLIERKRSLPLEYKVPVLNITKTNLKINEIYEQKQFLNGYINISEFDIKNCEKVSCLIKEKNDNMSYKYLKEIGDLLYCKNESVTLPSFNVVNSYALAFLYQNKINCVFLSQELNKEKIDFLLKEFKNRYNVEANVGYQNSGSIIIMHLKYNLDLPTKENRYALVDLKKNCFPINFDANGFLNLHSDFDLKLNYGIENTLKVSKP